jgi:hypothetical protein
LQQAPPLQVAHTHPQFLLRRYVIGRLPPRLMSPLIFVPALQGRGVQTPFFRLFLLGPHLPPVVVLRAGRFQYFFWLGWQVRIERGQRGVVDGFREQGEGGQ